MDFKDNKMKKAYSFDDVLLQPKYSNIESRSEVDLNYKLGEKINLSLPVISSPMDTVTETSMSVAMDKAGALGVIHRYGDISYQAGRVKDSYYAGVKDVAAAVGMSGDYL